LEYCLICFRDVKKVNEEGQCPECSEFMGEEEEHRLAIRSSPIRFDSTDSICFLEGNGWSISPNGESFVLGEEKVIEEIIRLRKIPPGVSRTQREEYERIFKGLEEKENESRRSRDGDGNSNVRAPKVSKRGSKRIRPVRNTGNRDKHFKPTKAPKRTTISRFRLKK